MSAIPADPGAIAAVLTGSRYFPYFGLRGVLLVRLGQYGAARTALERALALARTAQERAHMNRLARLEQVAHPAVFLASEDAGAITGAVVNLSCGMILD